MVSVQITNIEGAIEWIKTCPFHYAISSMSGGYVHMKLLIPVDERVDVTLSKDSFVEQVYEIAFGDDAINKDYSKEDVLKRLKEFSDEAYSNGAEVANPYVSDKVKALIEQINYTLGEEFANDVSKEPIDAVTRLHELAWALVKETSPDEPSQWP